MIYLHKQLTKPIVMVY